MTNANGTIRDKDQYELDIEYWMASRSENPSRYAREIRDSWGSPRNTNHSSLFRPLARNYDGSFMDVIECGSKFNCCCPTQIKSGEGNACFRDLTEKVLNDATIPRFSISERNATREALEAMAEVQRECDLYYSQLREIDAQPVYRKGLWRDDN